MGGTLSHTGRETPMPQQAWRTRAERADDVARVHEINADAFERPEEAELVDVLRADPAWIDGLSMVSVDDDDRPVGYALLTRCHIGHAPPALCLAPARWSLRTSARVPVRQRSSRPSTPRVRWGRAPSLCSVTLTTTRVSASDEPSTTASG